MMTSRTLAIIVWVFVFSAPLLQIGAEPAAAADRPNILFIMSDDHCARAIGAYDMRLAKLNPTPNLDALAKGGMLFDNVFCSNSICTPSRATVMTGQYSHVNGVFDLYGTLPGDKLYLPREMQKAGYTTAVVGKWHLKDSPKFFDYYSVIAGQGRYMNPVMHTNVGGEMRRVRFDSTLVRDIEVVDTEGHSSDVLTDITLEWLDKRRDKTKPFFLMHHFKAPHDMFVYAPRYENYLADADIPEPTNLYDQPGPDFGSIATRGENDALVGVIGSTISPQKTKRNLARHYRKKIQQMTGRTDLTDKELTHHAYQMYVKEYLRCVKGIDDNLQRIIDYLKKSDLLDKTIILYTSDQGMLLGEHDYIDKRWMYEESIRMPMIVHYPKMVAAGSRNDWLINNADFAPTMLALAGIAPPDYMQGHDFTGALKGEEEPASWRKATYYRYWMHMAHGHNNPGHFGIRTKTHKLIFFYGCDFTDTHNKRVITKKDGNRYWKSTPAAWEFYDLEKDPHEMVNQYANPKYAKTITELKAELKRIREEVKEDDSKYPRIQQVIDAHWDAKPLPKLLQGSRDEVYKTINGVDLQIYIFTPEGHKPTDRRPAAVFFFGGGWSSGTPTQFAPHAKYLASRGMVAMVADYRVKKRQGTTPFECVMDGKSAVRYIRTHAARLGIDPQRLAAGGGSAGGHVAAATGTVTGLQEEGEDKSVSAKPDALLLFNPVYDNGPEGYGHARVKDPFEEISPMHNIRKGAPPTVVFLGTNDGLIPVATAEKYKQLMEAAGSRCDLHLYEGAGHGFFNFGRKGGYYAKTVLEMDRFLQSLGYLEGPATIEVPADAPPKTGE